MPLLNTENQCCSLWVFTFDTYSLTVSIIATISLTTAQIIPEYRFSLTRIFWSVLIRENKRQKNFLFWQILRSTHRYNLIVYTKDRWSILLLRRSPYSVQIQENTDQEKHVFEHFSRSECQMRIYVLVQQLWWNFLCKK